MAKYLIETITTFRHRYVVEANCIEDAENYVKDGYAEEFSQKHIGDLQNYSKYIDDNEYLKLFNEDNDYLSEWTDEQKFGLVNDIKR
jgi:hypothetical protein